MARAFASATDDGVVMENFIFQPDSRQAVLTGGVG
jgi:hypothetical protein